MQGYGFESSNSLAVISAGDCGDADVEIVEIVSAINTTADMTQANYTLRNFSMDAVSFSPGDTYKLCWAHNATALGDFAVRMLCQNGGRLRSAMFAEAHGREIRSPQTR